MSMLLFQTSKRQLLDYLHQTVDEIPVDSSDESEQRKRNNLLRALEAGNRDLGGLQFWGGSQPDDFSEKSVESFGRRL